MTTHHTPGPWRYQAEIGPRNDGTQAVEFRLYGADETEIIGGCGCCGSPFMYGPAKANATLIAAAPDMLSVLIEAVECACVYDTNPALVELFQHVILKATGDKVGFEGGAQP